MKCSRIKSGIDKLLKSDMETVLYWISIFTIIFTAIVYFGMIAILNSTGNTALLECQLKRMFGIPCPGCGGTRSIISMFKGDVISGIYYNAFAAYGFVVYGIFFLTQTLQRITKGKIRGMKYRNIYLIIGVVILVVQYVIKLAIPEYRV